jgi:multidrug efflux pump subunit AcrB
MQRIFSALKSGFRQSLLILSLLSLIALSSLFISVEPSQAAPMSSEGQKLIQQESMDKASQATGDKRSQAYEEQVQAAKDIDKVYEDNAKVYKGSQPAENLIEKTKEGAQKLVDKATAKE